MFDMYETPRSVIESVLGDPNTGRYNGRVSYEWIIVPGVNVIITSNTSWPVLSFLYGDRWLCVGDYPEIFQSLWRLSPPGYKKNFDALEAWCAEVLELFSSIEGNVE